LIRVCRTENTPTIYHIVNEAAVAYAGHIPADCYHQPYMPLEELQNEMKRMTLYGWEIDGNLVGVMGMEPVKDVTLVRHAYVLTGFQGQGIGSKLIKHIEAHCPTERLLVGTWKAATWATDFYEHHGYQFQADKDALLKTYWDIPPRQIDTSVLLEKRVSIRSSPELR
jgi:GNAT superfamily N-acetyltransferase